MIFPRHVNGNRETMKVQEVAFLEVSINPADEKQNSFSMMTKREQFRFE